MRSIPDSPRHLGKAWRSIMVRDRGAQRHARSNSISTPFHAIPQNCNSMPRTAWNCNSVVLLWCGLVGGIELGLELPFSTGIGVAIDVCSTSELKTRHFFLATAKHPRKEKKSVTLSKSMESEGRWRECIRISCHSILFDVHTFLICSAPSN